MLLALFSPFIGNFGNFHSWDLYFNFHLRGHLFQKTDQDIYFPLKTKKIRKMFCVLEESLIKMIWNHPKNFLRMAFFKVIFYNLSLKIIY